MQFNTKANYLNRKIDAAGRPLIEQIPTLSRTTIYNTLNLLTEKEINEVYN